MAKVNITLGEGISCTVEKRKFNNSNFIRLKKNTWCICQSTKPQGILRAKVKNITTAYKTATGQGGNKLTIKLISDVTVGVTTFQKWHYVSFKKNRLIINLKWSEWEMLHKHLLTERPQLMETEDSTAKRKKRPQPIEDTANATKRQKTDELSDESLYHTEDTIQTKADENDGYMPKTNPADSCTKAEETETQKAFLNLVNILDTSAKCNEGYVTVYSYNMPQNEDTDAKWFYCRESAARINKF